MMAQESEMTVAWVLPFAALHPMNRSLARGRTSDWP